ncbi:hypothetical protein RvY_08279-2 [Ramazzottius varieornatus]|uniref:Peptidase M13 C-terminal domain-containing protein n=1 Tax=Ramazzottius varieornatus TaxID=947166 RepID=A0A1D1V7M5_RAMVA|nr:hypothetical protein RvY_08279-2 [Ramazzottius varieornatus]
MRHSRGRSCEFRLPLAFRVLAPAFSTNILQKPEFQVGLNTVQEGDITLYTNKTTFGFFQDAALRRSSLFRRFIDFHRGFLATASVSTPIDRSTIVVPVTFEVFASLDEIVASLEVMGSEGKRQLANYIGWQLINANFPFLSKDVQEIREKHLRRIKVMNEDTPPVANQTETTCIRTLQAALPLALELLYVKKYVPSDLQPKVAMLISDTEMGFAELLRQASWMTSATKDLALQKLDNMLNFVAFSNEVVNNKPAVNAEYSQVRIEATFFNTIQTVKRYLVNKNLKRLDMVNVRSDPFRFPMDITQVNAYNDFVQNIIFILSGILNAPLYDPQVPQYLNYGAIGAIIGHEITHGFDTTGALFDPNQILRVWWDNATLEAFIQRSQGIVQQYSGFCTAGIGCVNGQLTVGENIADNGGVKAAYRAYFGHFRDRVSGVPEASLPGFTDFTPEQMFFLSYSHVWCGIDRPDQARFYLLNDPHSPGEFRANGPLSNFDDFARAYNCPVGSKMNPLQKFSVW